MVFLQLQIVKFYIMKINRVTQNADIYMYNPVMLARVKSPTRPQKIIEALDVYEDAGFYCVVFRDDDGLFINRLNALRFILLVCKLSRSSSCLVERTIKTFDFRPFDINEFC